MPGSLQRMVELSRCEGERRAPFIGLSISGEVPLTREHPPGLCKSQTILLSLNSNNTSSVSAKPSASNSNKFKARKTRRDCMPSTAKAARTVTCPSRRPCGRSVRIKAPAFTWSPARDDPKRTQGGLVAPRRRVPAHSARRRENRPCGSHRPGAGGERRDARPPKRSLPAPGGHLVGQSPLDKASRIKSRFAFSC
jgi:hypothetical protein